MVVGPGHAHGHNCREVDKSLQQSDWEHPLTEQQAHYAALDAWLPLQIWLQVRLLTVGRLVCSYT